MESFVVELNNSMDKNDFNPNDKVFDSIWKEYERVILQSLVTSFGLDFIIRDQHGGDVDTVHNVRKIGDDPEMKYKNTRNEKAYENRGDYDSVAYHKDSRYISINKNVSEKKKSGELTDSYTGKKVTRNANIDLDHAISAKEIHEDRGRVLAGLDGLDLANNEDNLKPTDRSINRSMQDKDIDEYLAKWEEKKGERRDRISTLKGKKYLNDKERKELERLEKLEEIDPNKMRAENKRAREAYNAKIQRAYYTSGRFYRDTIIAAGNVGAKMGMRQAMGFVFVEIYMEAKSELKQMPENSSFEDMMDAIKRGVKNGVENAKRKYKEIFAKFGEGFVSGTLSSITTTICNIFFTTAKRFVRNIRQVYASIVQAGKVLLFNPDNLMFGDRIKTSTVIIATGASVLVGTTVSEVIGVTPLGAMPVVGPVTQTFSATLVSGLLSCTLLVFLDRSKFMNSLIDKLNAIPSEVNNYKEVADAFERLAAKIENIDIAKFKEDTERYKSVSESISKAESEDEMNNILLSAYKSLDIKIPWEGDFDTFMSNKNNRLVFG